MKKLCPVCFTDYIIREGIRTCSKQCSKEWMGMTPEMKARAREKAAEIQEIGLESLASIEIRDEESKPSGVLGEIINGKK